MANANDTRHYEFHLARNQNFAADDRLVIPDAANIEGAVVTLTLPESRTGSIPGNATHDHIQSWPLHTGSAACVLLSQDDNGVLSVGADGRWCRVTTKRRGVVELVASHVQDCEFGSEGRLLIRDRISQIVFDALDGHRETLTNAETAKLFTPTMWRQRIAKNTGTVYSAVPGATRDTIIRRWSHNLQESEVVWTATGNERAAMRAVSPDERFLAIEAETIANGQATEQSAMTIWDLDQQKEVSRHPCRVSRSIDFAPDGRMVAYTNANGVVLFEPQSGSILRLLAVAGLTGIAFSPDSQELATVSDDRMLRIWRIEDGSELHCIQAHGVSAKDVAYTPDGRTLGTVGLDGLFRCWRRGRMQMTMEVPFSSQLNWLEFSPDGTKAAITDAQGRAFLLTAAESAIEAGM